jgi:hypothetical protein
MIHRLRPLIFLFFSGSFFVAAALVLFYSFGYRINFERGIFIYTGSITIQSNPETVVVRVDGEEVPQKSLGIINKSIHIGGLIPGEHLVEVSAPGFQSWSKKTTIQSGLSSEFWNVLLVKENIARTTVPGTENAIRVFPSLKQNILAAAKQTATGFSIDVVRTDIDDHTQAFSVSDAAFITDDDENIEWSPENDRLIIPVRRNSDGAYLYYVSDITAGSALLLNDLPGIEESVLKLRTARWDPSTKNSLFFIAGTSLYRVDVGASNPEPVLVREHIFTYDLSGRYIYFLSAENGLVYRLPIGNTAQDPVQITLSPISTSLETDYALITYDEDRLTIRDKASGVFFIFNRNTDEPLRTIGSDIRGSQFSDDGKKLLFWSDSEVSVYFTENWEAQPFRDAESIMQIVRFSSPIHNTQWTKDYEHVIFSLGATVKIAELDHRDRRNINNVISFSHDPLQILSRFDENAVYFLRSDVADGSDALEKISFPETITFFGITR